MSVGGGSALRTAAAVLQAPVSAEMAQEWGECLWTAHDLAQAAYSSEVSRRSVGWLLGL